MTAPFPSPTSKWHDTTYPSLSPTRPELSAKGRTVIVVGGGSGIGAETARYFAEAGAARIGIFGRRQQPLLDTKSSIEKKFPNVEVFTASTDVTKKSDVDGAFAKFLGDKKVDVLVSAAAATGPLESVKDVDPTEFLKAVDQNISGSLFIAQAFLKHAATDAVVIDINSHAAHMNFGPGLASYSLSKLAVYRLWDNVAIGNPGLSVFHVQPGVVDTEMNRSVGGVAALGFEDHGKLISYPKEKS
jgi:NAD(P)-dependent dehydrogenase (short-subunit alcohol dehydrogenase family)